MGSWCPLRSGILHTLPHLRAIPISWHRSQPTLGPPLLICHGCINAEYEYTWKPFSKRLFPAARKKPQWSKRGSALTPYLNEDTKMYTKPSGIKFPTFQWQRTIMLSKCPRIFTFCGCSVPSSKCISFSLESEPQYLITHCNDLSKTCIHLASKIISF